MRLEAHAILSDPPKRHQDDAQGLEGVQQQDKQEDIINQRTKTKKLRS
jgi:hypothetical protein